MEELTLRSVTREDLDFIWELHRATMGEYLQQALGWDEARQRRAFDARLNLGVAQLVLRGGERIGVLGVIEEAGATVVGRISVLPSLQNQGIGTRLMRSIQEQSARKGLPVRLAVFKCNPAWKLYQRLGFEIERETDIHYFMIWRPQGGTP